MKKSSARKTKQQQILLKSGKIFENWPWGYLWADRAVEWLIFLVLSFATVYHQEKCRYMKFKIRHIQSDVIGFGQYWSVIMRGLNKLIWNWIECFRSYQCYTKTHENPNTHTHTHIHTHTHSPRGSVCIVLTVLGFNLTQLFLGRKRANSGSD